MGLDSPESPDPAPEETPNFVITWINIVAFVNRYHQDPSVNFNTISDLGIKIAQRKLCHMIGVADALQLARKCPKIIDHNSQARNIPISIDRTKLLTAIATKKIPLEACSLLGIQNFSSEDVEFIINTNPTLKKIEFFIALLTQSLITQATYDAFIQKYVGKNHTIGKIVQLMRKAIFINHR